MRTDAGERDAVAALPVFAFEPTEVEGREETFRAPVLEAEESAEADLMDARRADAIRGVEAVGEIGFTALRVVDVVGLAVIRLLVDQHRVEAVLTELDVFCGLHRLYFHRQRREVRAEQVEGLHEVRGLHLIGFARQDEQVIEAQLFERARFAENLARIECPAWDLIAGREAAVGADILTLVGEVGRCEELHRAPIATERALVA